MIIKLSRMGSDKCHLRWLSFPQDARILLTARYLIGAVITSFCVALILLADHATIASTVAFFVWDHTLLFPEEVACAWSRSQRRASRMCLLWTRYASLASVICATFRASLTSSLMSAPTLTRSNQWGYHYVFRTV